MGCVIMKWILNTYGGIAWTGILLVQERGK
jgi:hypothetical protein